MARQRIIQGTVISNKMDKTVVVKVVRRKKHRLYHKVMSLTKHYNAHDEQNRCREGDVVRIIECRPMSAQKRFRIYQVLTQGDVAEIRPGVIGRELEETTQLAAKHAETEEDETAEPGAETATATAEPAGEDDE